MFKKQTIALVVSCFVFAFLLGKPLEMRSETKAIQTIRRDEKVKSRIKIDNNKEPIELINAEVDQETGTRFSYFWIWDSGGRMMSEGDMPNICRRHASNIPIIGEIPTTIDLTNDSDVQKIIEKAKKYAFKTCPDLGKKIPYSQETRDSDKNRQQIDISLYSEKFDKSRIGNDSPIYASFNPYVDPTYNRLHAYTNHIKEAVLNREQNERSKRAEEEHAKHREDEKVKEAQRYATYLKEQKAKQEKEEAERQQEKQRITNVRETFAKKNGVQEWPNANALRANPFVYQGKTVAIVVNFGEMSSATEGLFEMGTSGSMNVLIVSDIPNGVFTSSRWVVLAGTVVGKKEVQLPLLGKVAIPHIKYVGVQNCPDQQCNGMGTK